MTEWKRENEIKSREVSETTAWAHINAEKSVLSPMNWIIRIQQNRNEKK